ncbi:hypothetical protein [Sphingobacterium faecium]
MSVKNRLKDYLKSQKIAIATFEKSIGVSNGYVNSISKSIGLDKLELIIENYSNMNIEWLLTGKGPIVKSEEYEISPEKKDVATEGNEEYGSDYWKNEYIAIQKKYTALLENKLLEVISENKSPEAG